MACPKCGKPWQEVRDNKLICVCGYVESIRPKIRTYPELLVENVQLKKEIEKLKKKIEELTQNRFHKATKSKSEGV